MFCKLPCPASPPRIKLMALAETSPEKQHHHHHHHLSMFTSFRETIRNSLRIWGSADSLDEPDNAKLQPPKNRRTGVDYLMPPPPAQPKVRRHTDITSPNIRNDMRKSESDPNIVESTETMFV